MLDRAQTSNRDSTDHHVHHLNADAARKHHSSESSGDGKHHAGEATAIRHNLHSDAIVHGKKDSSEAGNPKKHDDGSASKNGNVDKTVERIEKILKHDSHDFGHVFSEIESLRKSNPKQFNADLEAVNKKLHADKYLPNLEIVRDDHVGKGNQVEHGYDVISKDNSIKNLPGNYTVVSTSHQAPQESPQLQHAYKSMHYGHGKYSGWHQSVEGNKGADGGFDAHAVGGKVPTGARKELIDKALELAGVPVTPENEAAVNKIVTRESGWNPNITNHWDINAKKGHPSTGLMQTIPSTFKQYALKGYDSNIHDPLSNLVAGIRYAQARYARGGHSGVAVVASRPGGY
jgi:hypothetical protein